MTKYIIRRLLQAIPIMFGITLFSYWLISLAPGGPVEQMAFNNRMKPQEKEELKYKLGVNDPFPVQYLRWLLGDDWMRWDSDGDGLADGAILIDLHAPVLKENGKPLIDKATGEIVRQEDALPPGDRYGILRGDFGNSFFYKRPAIDVVRERLPATLELSLSAFVLGTTAGLAVGVLAAINRGRWFDQVSRVGAVIVNSMPSFGLGLILILIFAAWLRVLPFGGRCQTTLDPACVPLMERLDYLILPVIVIAAGAVAGYSRFMRASMLDVVSQDYIRTARAKGLGERKIWQIHGLRNALIPIATFIGPSITFLLAGATVTESVFAWPGAARTLLNAAGQRDFPIVMLVVVYAGVANVLGYLLSDILYALIDPRIRYD